MDAKYLYLEEPCPNTTSLEQARLVNQLSSTVVTNRTIRRNDKISLFGGPSPKDSTCGEVV